MLRAQLIDAAAKLLATLDQPETLTLRQVAREVGVAPASIYSHFPDLGALVQHVLRLRYEELARLMDEAARTAPDPLADVVGRCAAYVHWGIDQPGHYRTLFGGRMPTDLLTGSAHGVGEELFGALVVSLAAVTDPDRAQGMRQGRRQEQTQAQTKSTPEQQWQAGLLLWTALHGLVSLYNEHGDMAWPPLDDLLADLIGLHTGRPAADIAALLASGEGQGEGEG